MNIPSTRSGDHARASQVQGQRALERPAGDPVSRPSRPDGVERPAAGRRGEDLNPTSPEQRLEGVSQTVGARLDYLIENGDLSDDQKEALLQAKAEFQGYMERLGGALEDGDFAIDGKAAKNFARFMGNLRDDVRDALDPVQVDPPAAREESTGAVQPTAARRVGDAAQPAGDGDPRAEALSARLENAQERIEDRLRNLRSTGMDEEGAARLAEAYDQFSDTFDRLQYGIENGTLGQRQLAKGFQFALAQVRDALRPQQSGDQDLANVRSGSGVDEATPVSPSPAERLEAVSSSIEERLQGLVDGLDPEAARALDQAGERFDALTSRLASALEGGFSSDKAGDLFSRMLGQLRGEVNSILGRSNGAAPTLYDSGLGTASLYPLDSTGLDARV